MLMDFRLSRSMPSGFEASGLQGGVSFDVEHGVHNNAELLGSRPRNPNPAPLSLSLCLEAAAQGRLYSVLHPRLSIRDPTLTTSVAICQL